jgi:hypothetical protein
MVEADVLQRIRHTPDKVVLLDRCHYKLPPR